MSRTGFNFFFIKPLAQRRKQVLRFGWIRKKLRIGIGKGGSLDVDQSDWNECRRRYVQHAFRYGSSNMPTGLPSYNGGNVAVWLRSRPFIRRS